jgi:aminocarboxymuconate-semialdehyde decarboxylase
MSRLSFDTITHDQLSLEFLGRRVGWDHVFLGSDYPFDMADHDPVSTVRGLDLSDADETRVLIGSGEAFLRSSGEDPEGVSS